LASNVVLFRTIETDAVEPPEYEYVTMAKNKPLLFGPSLEPHGIHGSVETAACAEVEAKAMAAIAAILE
jgi:hypothetical protein